MIHCVKIVLGKSGPRIEDRMKPSSHWKNNLALEPGGKHLATYLYIMHVLHLSYFLKTSYVILEQSRTLCDICNDSCTTKCP